LRQQVLNTLVAHEDLDSSRLRDHLSEAGYSNALKTLLSKNVYMHAKFARPDQSTEDALEGWQDTLGRYSTKFLATELKQIEAEAASGEDTSDTAFGRIKALKAT